MLGLIKNCSGLTMSLSARRLQIVLSHVNSCSLSYSVRDGRPSIHAEPRVALYDDEIRLALRNFAPQEKVTLHGQVVSVTNKVTFASCGQFVTDGAGHVDLTKDASLGGTFTGVEPMGILWSLTTAPGQPKNTRMAINITDRPCMVTLRAYKGHLNLEDLYAADSASGDISQNFPLAELELERSYRGPGVTRVEVEDGNVRGALYLPPGEGPFQGVIDMFGSSGGLIEYRSALLASRGFAALSLAYFKYKDLQSTLIDLRYEYFEEAIEWLSNHPKVVSRGIGAIAVSKGTENALIMATYSPKVTAAVAINGYCNVTAVNYLRNDQVFLRGGELSADEMTYSEEEGFNFQGTRSQIGDVIPIWQGNAKYLFLESLDDFQMCPGIIESTLGLCPLDRKEDIEHIKYEGAGHLLEPPYNPLCRSSINKGFGLKMKWGGHPRQHAYAQVDAWKRTLEFFKRNIPSS